MLVCCDTSPRGLDLPGDAEHWDFGVGAGFYVDATQAPWSGHYRMGSYVNDELPTLIEANFPALADRRGIFGHSMGGHGALVTALRHPARWQSVSAFAPISHPSSADRKSVVSGRRVSIRVNFGGRGTLKKKRK